jgi:hypothetical protein
MSRPMKRKDFIIIDIGYREKVERGGKKTKTVHHSIRFSLEGQDEMD